MANTKEGTVTPVAETEESSAPAKSGAAARVAARRAAKAARKAAQRGPAEDLLTDKEIAEGVQVATSWLDRNQRMLWGMLAGLLAAGILVITVSNKRQQADRDATDALREGARAAIAPVIPETELSAQADEDKDKDDRETFPTEKARAEEALAKFKKATKNFKGTIPAHWARLGEGNELLELGRYKEAEKEFRTLSAANDQEDYLRFRAFEGLGFALEGQKRYADAQKAFESGVAIHNGLYRAQADLHVARMLAAQGKRDEAVKRLQELVTLLKERDVEKNLKEDDVQTEAEQKLAELGAPVEKGGISPDFMKELQRQLGSAGKVISPGAAGQ